MRGFCKVRAMVWGCRGEAWGQSEPVTGNFRSVYSMDIRVWLPVQHAQIRRGPPCKPDWPPGNLDYHDGRIADVMHICVQEPRKTMSPPCQVVGQRRRASQVRHVKSSHVVTA